MWCGYQTSVTVQECASTTDLGRQLQLLPAPIAGEGTDRRAEVVSTRLQSLCILPTLITIPHTTVWRGSRPRGNVLRGQLVPVQPHMKLVGTKE